MSDIEGTFDEGSTFLRRHQNVSFKEGGHPGRNKLFRKAVGRQVAALSKGKIKKSFLNCSEKGKESLLGFRKSLQMRNSLKQKFANYFQREKINQTGGSFADQFFNSNLCACLHRVLFGANSILMNPSAADLICKQIVEHRSRKKYSEIKRCDYF